jgi:P4 family phage/plasmid primase-like protien
MTNKFLSFFPNHVYRYIDLTGQGRSPQPSEKKRDDLNLKGYESYFTVNGFLGAPNSQKNNCSNLNAFFVDIDGRKDLEELEAIKLKLDPSFITETKNGYHIYWLLDEPIYKDELTPEEWEAAVSRWEKLELSIVTELKSDPVVKDITRILRVPDTYYWKKTGDQWEKGTEGVFKIKGIYKNTANTYSMDQVEKVFPVVEVTTTASSLATATADRVKRMADAERNNFFERVNEEFPIEERDSFKNLISASKDALIPTLGRNNSLHITACLMRQAGWSQERALKQIETVGWYGMESEPGGAQEIFNTIRSAFEGSYTYSYKNELISYNMSPTENQRIQQAYTKVLKDRKEQDKIRFSNYEQELLVKHPHLRKNDVGLFFQYSGGVYKMVNDQEMSDMVLNGLYDDMLWGSRTKKNVSDKIACLLSIIPLLVVTDDKGYIANVKNGLLNIYTKELMPHTPDFVSLVQYPVNYDPTATAPNWEKCVGEWMSGPEAEEKTRLLQQFCGYCLSSSMLYDRALFMVGDGGNGKSTFIDTIAMVIGAEATSHIDLEGLYGQYGFKGLIGKRLNIIEEVHGNYYQSNKLKKLISGEQVTIDIKYKDQFTFRPQAKFAFSVNMLPRVDDTSTATERRILAVQFLNNYRTNPNLELRSSVGLLAQELSGILNWMIEGAIDLSNEKKFVTTEEQTRMLDEYREENSSVEGFLSQCVILNEFTSIEVPTLYEEYKAWSMSDGGRKIKANITFTKEVRAYGAKGNRFTYEARTSGSKESKFIGIELAPQWKKQRNIQSYNN